MKIFIKTLLKVFTPFIVSLVDSINGILMYLSYKEIIFIDKDVFSSLDHFSGSSIILICYILSRSSHMCKYYKISCYLILAFHIYAEIYLYTEISFHWFVYLSWVLLSISVILSIIYILGAKTRKLIRQAYKRV